MRAGIVLSCLFFITVNAFSQEGNYYLSHFNPAEYNFDNYNYDILQDQQGVVHIANRQGLLNYDGKSWWLTKTPFSLFSLAIDEEGIIYTGGREGFGRFIRDDEFNLTYIPLDSQSVDVFDSYYSDGVVYFIDESSVYLYDKQTRQITEIVSGSHGELIDLNGRDDKIWVVTKKDGLLEIIDGDLIYPADIEVARNTSVMRGFGNKKAILYTSSGQFYYSDDGKVTNLNIDDEGYLNNNIVTQMEWVNDSLMAVSTLIGGVVFVAIPSGQIQEIINHDTGLPDDEIYNIFTDAAGAVWASHPYGITILSPNLPFRTFSFYPGLEGTLQQVVTFRDQLYVATTGGVYKLNELKEYSERIVLKEVMVQDSIQADELNVADTITVVPAPRTRRGLFGFLKKKNRSTPENTIQEIPEVSPTTQIPAASPTYERQVVRTLKAIRFAFEKVEGISAKTTQFLEFNGELLAATRAGVYQIMEDTAIQLVELPAESIFGHERSGLLFISTSQERVFVLAKENGAWVRTRMLEGLKDLINQIIADPQENIWLCGADSVYQVGLNETALSNVDVYKISNPYFERLYATIYQDQIYFINSSGYFTFNNGKIIQQKELESKIGLPNKFLQSPDGNLWINSEKGWFGESGDISKKLSFLSLVPDPKALALEGQNMYWVITSQNELFKVDGHKVEGLPTAHGLYLKEIRLSEKKLSTAASLSLEQEDGVLTFEFATPDYIGIYGTQYQFRLKGLTNEWSPWSGNNNVVTYPYLPANNYTLEVRTKDVLGNIEMAVPFNFQVQAPYWRRPWFYLAELVFFGGLLFLSFRLSRSSGKYTLLSRLLGFMTLILIVEFFQTIAEAKLETDESPVIDFFIQAFVALLILPVEGLIRGFITTRDEKKSASREMERKM